MDFTIIGDRVNLAARLCTAASHGEIVADTGTVKTAGATEWRPENSGIVRQGVSPNG